MKRQRHEVVVDLINKYDIETQEELSDYLQKEGYQVTQATVSREKRPSLSVSPLLIPSSA